ncbi:tetratricopeptide repeat protein [Tenacibaculum tangerinum]|uniref:Tetratricopeptide repeat protein n=1 Tax=Tenacibaculum tangerinum TaxID=3038772 RepID=A0ABY8L6L7_9FLAO|nr:tetratricopeptide repeat protein [Tenacibaculum tangerinum]WGH77034.1 tetratricopeptide repeat protein [Tenacibaculum tangerinum]
MRIKILLIVFVIGLLKVEAQVSTFKTIDSLVNIGRYQTALTKLHKMDTTFQSTSKIASIYASIDNYKQASLHYEKALELQDDYTTKVRLAKAYQKQKNLQKAIAIYEAIVSKDPKNLLIQYQLGKLYTQTKQPAKAIDTFKNITKQDSTNANYHYRLGLAYGMLKKQNLKINSFLEAYKNDHEHIQSIHQLALAYTFLRDKDSASLFVDRGLAIDKNHINLNKLKINNLYIKEQFSEAIQLLKRIDSLEPNEHYTQKMLGRSYFHLKKYDEAKEHFNKALRIDRSDFKAYTYLGDINFEKKKFYKAQLDYMIATTAGKEPRDVEYYQLGNVYEKLGNPEQALKSYKRAFEENRKNYRALYQLALKSEDYYKDKRIAYKHYSNYVKRFEKKDTLLTKHAKTRLKEIKKFYFLQGEVLE